MRKKKDDIVTYTTTELRARRAAGLSQTDWKKAAKMPVPDGSDPDDAIEDTGWFTTELPMPKRKEHVNLRIDADIMDYFRKQGKGYQTMMNAVLRSYVDQSRHAGRR